MIVIKINDLIVHVAKFYTLVEIMGFQIYFPYQIYYCFYYFSMYSLFVKSKVGYHISQSPFQHLLIIVKKVKKLDILIILK